MRMTLARFREHEGVIAPKLVGDGRVAFLYRMMYTWALVVGDINAGGAYDDRWCYHDRDVALAALADWDGTGEPDGWHRHPTSGRRRPDGARDAEYVAQ